MKTRKLTAAALAALAIFGAPLIAPCTIPLGIAEAAFVSRDADQMPYNENVEVDPYGQAYFRPLPAILRERRETLETPRWKMPWSGFGFFAPPGEMGNVFAVLGEEAEEEKERALAGKNMAVYNSRYVQRMDTCVTSILESRAAYQGGHRGRFSVTGRNFDSRSGRELALDDVFTNPVTVGGLISEHLRVDYPNVAFRDDLLYRLQEKAETGKLSWTLFARGAIFYFEPREIVHGADRYDTGQMIYTATILYEEVPVLFTDEYRQGSPAWSMELEPGTPVRVPLGGGTKAILQVGGHKIRLGDHEFIEEGALRYQRFTFVSLMDGRCYLYADVAPHEKSEPHELRVYRLSAEGIERLPGSRPLTMLASPPDDDEDRLILPMISPGNFCLCEAVIPGEQPTDLYRWLRVQDLTEIDVYQLIEEEKAHVHYHVGPDGWPEVGQMWNY